MTPSINRLAGAAEALGAYILDAEYILLRDEFSLECTPDLDTFKEWAEDYQYYNALVCVCGGQIGDIDSQLQADYEELVVMYGGVAA